MGRNRLIYFIATGLLTAMMGMSAVMYTTQYDKVAAVFGTLGYPTYLVYPLAVAKVLAVLTLWVRPSKTLVGLAYAGLFYDFVLALTGHVMVGDGEFAPAAVAIVLVAGSYFTQPQSA